MSYLIGDARHGATCSTWEVTQASNKAGPASAPLRIGFSAMDHDNTHRMSLSFSLAMALI